VATENTKIVDLFLGTSHSSDGRFNFGVEIVRPENVDDEDITVLAEYVMQSMAIQLGFDKEHYRTRKQRWLAMIQEYVRAKYETERGVTLTTNIFGGCSLETDGNNYKSTSRTIHLNQHNIYNQEQEFILTCGAVAIARAETLVAEMQTRAD
jgi:hypothetical protein